jgi:cystathionine beta-lyase/cystathionine gamma-synthase
VGSGYVYQRWANPTVDRFESAVAALEGAEQAAAFASGMAAISAVFLALCRGGDRVVSTRQLYGNTHSLVTETLPRYGISATTVDVDDLNGIEQALAGARLLYCETIGNPRARVADLKALGSLAAAAGVPLIVDNTFASPVLCRPLEHGAAASLHSATKFIGGHHDLLGGVVCGSPEIIDQLRGVARDFGGNLAPFNAWLALRGIETLPLRVERSCATCLSVAQALGTHPKVEAVFYPLLSGNPDVSLCESLLGGRGGGVVGFDVAGGRAGAKSFLEGLQLIKQAASLGGTNSLIVHSASVTHTQLGPRELEEAGISEGFCRLSVGLEDPADLIEDLTSALESVV